MEYIKASGNTLTSQPAQFAKTIVYTLRPYFLHGVKGGFDAETMPFQHPYFPYAARYMQLPGQPTLPPPPLPPTIINCQHLVDESLPLFPGFGKL